MGHKFLGMTALNYNDTVIDDIRRWLDGPIVMIGMMGAGKTRMGRLLADTLGLSFADSDEEVEKAAGMSIAEIFERFGEPYFRDGERRVIRRLLEDRVGIVATGGGAVMTPETADLIFGNAVSIWVRAELPVMLERTARNDKRPLLQAGEPEQILRELMERRYPIYEKADIVLESHNGPAESILNQALDKLHGFLRARKRRDQ